MSSRRHSVTSVRLVGSSVDTYSAELMYSLLGACVAGAVAFNNLSSAESPITEWLICAPVLSRPAKFPCFSNGRLGVKLGLLLINFAIAHQTHKTTQRPRR